MSDGFEAVMDAVHKEDARSPRVMDFGMFNWSQPLTHQDLTHLAVGLIYNKPKETSRRWVTIQSVTLGTPEKIGAYCWASGGFKSFRLDRVESIFDAQGELMTLDHFFGAFGVSISNPVVTAGETRRVMLDVPVDMLSKIDSLKGNRPEFFLAAAKDALMHKEEANKSA